MAVDYQVYHVLDGDTSIVAQPGVQSRVFGGTNFPSFVALQYRLRCWTQLGARGNGQQLPGPENENTVLTATILYLIEFDDTAVSNAYTFTFNALQRSEFCALHPGVIYNFPIPCMMVLR
jgi:hypothetical protein